MSPACFCMYGPGDPRCCRNQTAPPQFPTWPYHTPYTTPTQKGWICPKCGGVNAPWMPSCGNCTETKGGTEETAP